VLKGEPSKQGLLQYSVSAALNRLGTPCVENSLC
jgi:hypothetical protein